MDVNFFLKRFYDRFKIMNKKQTKKLKIKIMSFKYMLDQYCDQLFKQQYLELASINYSGERRG